MGHLKVAKDNLKTTEYTVIHQSTKKHRTAPKNFLHQLKHSPVHLAFYA